MKKSKLSLGLVTAFIAATALSACDVTAKKGSLVTFTPYGGGKAVEVVTDDMYSKYHNTTDGINKFYSQILEVLIRYKFQNPGNDGLKGALTLKEIEAKADNDVKEQKQKAKDAASSNGTTYDHEWDSILDSYNVESTKELREVFIYNREKEEISKWYLNSNIDQLRKEFIGVNNTGAKVASKVDSALPYHIRHILVKTESGASDFSGSTISSSEAKHLYNTLSKLKDGKQSFAQVAYDESDDGSGQSAYGDVGIVTNQIQSSGSLQMVSEFQLGIYAYEAILGGQTDNAVISDGLGVEGKYKDSAKSIKEQYKSVTGLVKVPYDAVEKLYSYADIDKDDYGNILSEGSSMVYPRNIIWNKYFNHHQVFVITNAKGNVGTNQNETTDKTTIEGAVKEFTNLTTTTYDNLGDRFVSVPGICATGEKVLTDGQGHVILGVRSEYGIHLIVVQKSIYDFANSKVSLEEYYTTEVPTSTNTSYPRDDKGNDKDTYVNFIKTTTNTDYNTRANTVKDAIKSFDSTYEYRLYESLTTEFASQIKFKGEEGKELNKAIDRYIEVTRNSKHNNQVKKLNSQWESYIELLELQENTRNVYYAYGKDDANNDKYKTLMIPEGCAVNFHKGGKDYEEGGKCYYGK